MSSGSQIGGIIGGTIGFVASGFNPMGFQIGYAIGSAVGGYVDPIKVHGPRLEDASAQTSSVGGIIPFGYGVFTCTGNIIWVDRLIEHKKTERVGKGGGQKNITYTYTRSYAIGVCEGPIHNYLWIKKNGKLVYAADPAGLGAAMGWDSKQISDLAAASAKFMQETTLYYGTDSQMPDSTIVAVEGVGNVSPFRDLAYIVKENEDLTDTAGAVSQYEFCIRATPPEAYLTSLPYPQIFYSEAKTAFAPTGGKLVRLLYDATMQSDEARTGLAPTDGALFEVPPPEFHDAASSTLLPIDGVLKYPPLGSFNDAASTSLAPTSGVLKVPPTGTIQKDEVTSLLVPTGGSLVATLLSPSTLFHFDGPDNSTTFVDEYGKTWAVNGNLRIKTDKSKFGGSSAYFDGNTAYLSMPASQISLDNQVFTLELWAWIPNPSSWVIPSGNSQAYSNVILGQSNKNSYGEQVLAVATTGAMNITLQRGSSGYSWNSAANVVPWEQWVHLAWVIDSDKLRCYVNGTNVLTVNTTRKWATPAPDVPLTIGYEIVQNYPQYKMFWNGYVDEFRLTVGSALYASDFTPPSSPFPNP